MVRIGSNIFSLNAQRRLTESTNLLSDTFERLSSGQRINKASDDAAGLSIVSSLNTDKRVFSQGIRNLNDGVSALTIAEGALEALSSIVIRLQELAEQSANGVYGTEQRQALDQEAQELSKEYFRISKTTEFNGLNLLDGTMDELRLQAGYGLDGGIASGVGGAIGTGNFGEVNTFGVGLHAYDIAAGDMNNDGILDLVTANNSPDTVSVLLGNGNGSFIKSTSHAVGLDPYSIIVGDLNGDGILDLATANYTDGTVSTLIGVGNGSFKPKIDYSVSHRPSFIASADLDGDGMLDLVISDSSNDTHGIKVLFGEGDGTFQDAVTLTSGGYPHAVALEDLNDDGIIDMAVADTKATGSLSVYIGLGDGSFANSRSISSANKYYFVTSGDLNGDGVPDLVTADKDVNTVSVFLGNGDGNFKEGGSNAVGIAPESITIGDFNGDGTLDLATADRDGRTISLLIGKGDGSFNSATSRALSTFTRSIATGDFNRDGVLDLTTALMDGTTCVFLAQTKDGVAPLLPFDLTTMADARQALPVFQQKLEQLSSQRGQIGALQSRLSVAMNVLGTTVENSAAAASRILDADIAQETSQLVRTQILQQAGSAVLSQANQQPALALMLLSAR